MPCFRGPSQPWEYVRGRGGPRKHATLLVLLLEPAPDGFDHGLLVGELAGLQLRVDQVAVGAQLEAAAFRRDQLQVLDLLFVGGEQFGRQTDGLWLVVSHRAILEFQVHNAPFP